MNRETPDFSSMYSTAVKAATFLSAEEEAALLVRWKQFRDPQALHRVLLAHNRLVMKMARRRPKMYSLTDMVQEGNVGMLEAAEKWTPEKGVRFATYARFWIDNNIRTYIKGMTALTMRGRGGHLQIQIAYLSNALKRIDPMISRDAVVAAIAERTGTTLDVVSSVIGVQESANFSLDASTYANGDEIPNGGAALTDACDIEGEVSSRLDSNRQVLALSSALQQLDGRIRDIIRGRYGIGRERVTLEYLADEHGISRERVRQLENRGLRELKELMSVYPVMAEGVVT